MRKLGHYEFRDTLPSHDSRLAFTAAFRLDYTTRKRLVRTLDTSLLASAAVVCGIAQDECAKWPVWRATAAHQEVVARVSAQMPFRLEGLTVRHVGVNLSVDDATLEMANRLQQARWTHELESMERERLAARIAFIRESVLNDPANARIFWFLERRDEPTDGMLDGLVRTVNEWNHSNRWVVIAQVLNEFISDLSESRKDYLVTTIRRMVESWSRDDLAQKIR